MAYTVTVNQIPKCDIPGCTEQAYVDAKTIHGPWANLCVEHYKSLGIGVGKGLGQIYVLETSKEEYEA
jgi:hypothetical protein